MARLSFIGYSMVNALLLSLLFTIGLAISPTLANSFHIETERNASPSLGNGNFLIDEDSQLILQKDQLASIVYTDADGDTPVSMELESEPTVGDLQFWSNSTLVNVVVNVEYSFSEIDSFRYRPAVNYNGTVEWQWKWSDGTNFSNIGDITVNILSVIDEPLISKVSISVEEESPLILRGSNFIDAFVNPDGPDLSSIRFSQLPKHGQLSFGSANVSLTDVYAIDEGFQITYSSDEGYDGADTIGWEANPSGANADASGLVLLDIHRKNRGPLVQDIDTAFYEDVAWEIPASFFMSKAVDPDDDDIVGIYFLTLPDQGVFTLDGLIGDTLVTGELYRFESLGNITFLPESNFSGELSVTWKLEDDKGNLSTEALLALSIIEVNDVPGFFDFKEPESDTLSWAGGAFRISWSESLDPDVSDTLNYTWQLNLRDTVVSIEMGDATSSIVSLSPTFLSDPGVFLMWLTVTDGEVVVKSKNKIFKVVNEAITSIADGYNALQVYPNPVKPGETVTISRRDFEIKGALLNIYSETGESLFEGKISDGSDGDSLRFQVPSNALPGFYFFRIEQPIAGYQGDKVFTSKVLISE